MFSQSFAAAQLQYPDLDYNLEYPHYNSTAPLVQNRDQQARLQAIAQLGQQYGLFYFYRGAIRWMFRWREWWLILRKQTICRLSLFLLMARSHRPSRNQDRTEDRLRQCI
jgi:hypothetical protein